MEPIKQTKLQAPLVEVLADQTTKRVAVLEKRLADNLAQQAATSQILRIIRESPGHVQPVFDTIANAALHLCSASSANVCTFDGQLLRMAAVASTQEGGAEMIRAAFPRRPGRETAAGRAVTTGRVTSIPPMCSSITNTRSRIRRSPADFAAPLQSRCFARDGPSA